VQHLEWNFRFKLQQKQLQAFMLSKQAAVQAVVTPLQSRSGRLVAVSPSEWTMKVSQAMGIFRFANGLQEREYNISFTLQ